MVSMLSVVIATFNDDAALAETLTPLVSAAVDGLVQEVIVADGGSTDATLAIADDTGANVVPVKVGLTRQLAAGCRMARGDWLLILTPGVRLREGWERAVEDHIAAGNGRAGYFRTGRRIFDWFASLGRGLGFAPAAVPALLISRRLYDASGGYREDEASNAFLWRLGVRRLTRMPVSVGGAYRSSRTSARREPEAKASRVGVEDPNLRR